MKLRLISSILFFFSVGSAQAGTGPVWRTVEPVKDEYIVVLNDVLPSQVEHVASELARQHDAQVLVTLKHATKGFGARMTAARAEALALHPLVHHVEENAKMHLSSTQSFPDDSRWYLDRVDDSPYYWQGSTYRAFTYTYTGAGVDVYVIDSGILGTHEQFQGRVLPGQTYGDGYAANNPCNEVQYEPCTSRLRVQRSAVRPRTGEADHSRRSQFQ